MKHTCYWQLNSCNSISSPVLSLILSFFGRGGTFLCPHRPIMSPMSPGKFWSFQLKGDMAYSLVCLSVCPSVAKKWHELCVSSVKRDTWGTYVFLLLLCEKSNRNLVSVSKHILSLFVLCAYTSCMYVHVYVYMYLYIYSSGLMRVTPSLFPKTGNIDNNLAI